MDFEADTVLVLSEEELRKYVSQVQTLPAVVDGEPLIIAVLKRGCVAVANLQILRDAGMDVLAKDKNGRNGLMTLLRHFYVIPDYFSDLLRAFQWSLSDKDDNGRSLAHYSAAVPEVCSLLLERRLIAVEERDDFAFTPMHFAAMVNEFSSIEYLRVHGAELDSRDKAGMTPLLRGCQEGSLACVKTLLRLGAQITAVSDDGMTALHCAALSGKLPMVTFLVEDIHMNLSAQTNMKNTVLHKAAESGDVEIIKYLESKGLSRSALTSIGTNMLQKAAFRKLEAVKYFLSLGFDPHYVNEEGDNAVIMAAERGKVKIVRYLHQVCSADLFAPDKLGHTALSLAKGERRRKVKEYIDGVIAENWACRKPVIAAMWRSRHTLRLV